MLLFAASWHDGIHNKFLDGYHHGKWMTMIILFNGFKGDLTWISGLLIMDLMKDVTCDAHIKKIIQQVDKSMFSRIGQHSTPTGTTYIHMKQSAAEYRKALFLQLCVQWTAKSTVRFTICMLLLSIYNHIMVFWVVTCVNVGGYKCLKRTCQLHLQDKNERERCGHVL